jgi:hypothetical protein
MVVRLRCGEIDLAKRHYFANACPDCDGLGDVTMSLTLTRAYQRGGLESTIAALCSQCGVLLIPAVEYEALLCRSLLSHNGDLHAYIQSDARREYIRLARVRYAASYGR